MHVDFSRNLPNQLPARLTSWLAVLCLLLQSGPLQALPSAAPDLEDMLAELRTAAKDHALTYTKEALVDANDYDASAIIDFVSSEVAFQPYSGVLRGIDGTLAGRAGNAHDQSLTLASMLKDSGYDAQILVGTLTTEQATMLVAQTRSASCPTPPTDTRGAPPVLQRVFEHARNNGQDLSPLAEQTKTYASLLLQRFADQMPEDEMVSNAIRVSIPYRWVRYREGPSTEWIEVHPAYPAAGDWQLQFERAEDEAIDPADVQTVGIEVWIEDSDGNRHSVSGAWEAPATELFGRPISIELLSDATLQTDFWVNPGPLINQSEFFFVKINGSLPAEGKLFDLYGDILSGSAMDGLNSIFSAMNRRGREAADALNALGFGSSGQQEDSRKQLSKVWVEFRLESPDEQTERIERVLFDGQGLENRPQSTERLLQRWDLDVLNTTPLESYYRGVSTERFAAALSGYHRMQRYLERPATAPPKDIGVRAAEWMENPAHGRLQYLRQMFDQFPIGEGVVSYPNRPNILAIRQGLVQTDGYWNQYEMTDIVSNKRVAFRLNGTDLVGAYQANVGRGIWETMAEAWRPLAASPKTQSTSAYQALTSVDVKELTSRLADGYLQLAASGSGAWWQVDLRSGSTIGMQQTFAGTGGQAAEFLTVLTLSVSVIFFLIGSSLCVDATNNVECCVATNFAIATVGFAIGWAAGIIGLALLSSAGAASAGAVASVAADIGLTNAPIDCQ